jgi:hypothetical protein
VPLEAYKRVTYLCHATKLSRSIADGPVFQLQQMRKFGLIEIADAFFDVLRYNKIQKRLKLLVVTRKYLLPVRIPAPPA